MSVKGHRKFKEYVEYQNTYPADGMDGLDIDLCHYVPSESSPLAMLEISYEDYMEWGKPQRLKITVEIDEAGGFGEERAASPTPTGERE